MHAFSNEQRRLYHAVYVYLNASCPMLRTKNNVLEVFGELEMCTRKKKQNKLES